MALVFFGPDSHARLAQVEARQRDIEEASGLRLEFDVRPPEQRIKTKVMVYRPFPVAFREGQSEEIATWAVATFVSLCDALQELRVFDVDGRRAFSAR